MKHTEYIVPIGEDAQDYDEMFIGVIRRQPVLIRCKDCKRYREYTYLGTQKVYVCERDRRKRIFDMNADDFCSRGERKEHETD